MTGYSKYVRKRLKLERIRVIGPMEISKDVMQSMHDANWHITRSGPYMRGYRADVTRFLFIAERDL